MGETYRVEAGSTEGSTTGPTLEEQAAAMDATGSPQPDQAVTTPTPVEAEPEPQAPSGEQVDELILGKFKSQQELAAAYLAAERALHERPEAPAPAAAEEGEEPAEAPQTQEPTDPFAPFYAEYEQTRTLSERSLEALEKQGYSRALVQNHMKGLEALAAMQAQEVYSSVGGEEQYTELVHWANGNIPEAEAQVFNEELASNDTARIVTAVKNLNARRMIAEGQVQTTQNQPLQGAPPVFSGPKPFASNAEYMEAVGDPRYDRDPAFREQVIGRLAISPNVMS